MLSFLDYCLSKYEWIFTKLGVCIDIVEFWFGVANGHILSVFDRVIDNFSKYQQIFTKLGLCIDIVKFWFGIANGQISSIFDRYLPVTRQYFCFQKTI